MASKAGRALLVAAGGARGANDDHAATLAAVWRGRHMVGLAGSCRAFRYCLIVVGGSEETDEKIRLDSQLYVKICLKRSGKRGREG